MLRQAAILRCLLFAVAGFIIFTGLNVGLGGIRTIGWQGSPDFIEVTDPAAYAVQDSHVRFLGGLWFGVGIALMVSSAFLSRMRQSLMLLLLLIVAGGLARFSSGQPDVLFASSVTGSLAAELILMPLLMIWVWRAGQNPNEEKSA